MLMMSQGKSILPHDVIAVLDMYTCIHSITGRKCVIYSWYMIMYVYVHVHAWWHGTCMAQIRPTTSTVHDVFEA